VVYGQRFARLTPALTPALRRLPKKGEGFRVCPLDPPQRQIQIQANQLVAHGKPGQAARLFAQLAEVESADHPQRAAWPLAMHVQAALAFADDQQGPAALIQARAALHLFFKEKMASVRRNFMPPSRAH
jgi:hypothetical protein